MQAIRIALITVLTACSTSAAWAQYGLYGSPEPLRLPPPDASSASAVPISYPATATPALQPAVAPTYNYPPQAQAQYGYPAQPPAMVTYPQYQPAAQYYYPAPANRPPVRIAAVAPAPTSQPIPVPPGPAPTSVPAAPGPAPAPGYPAVAPSPGYTSPSPAAGYTSPAPAAGYASPAPAAGCAAPASQGPSLMNQMLIEQNAANCAPGGGAYRGAVNQFQQAAGAPCADGCGGNIALGQGYFCPWYASVSALVMGRSDSRRLWTTYEDGNLPNQLMNSQFPMEWKWGGEVQVGHRFCWDCVPCAIEGTYWTTQSFTGSQTATVAGGYVSTTLDVDYITFRNQGGVDEQAANWFFGAESQTLARRDEFHNVEINLIREQLAWACDSPWDIGWSCGVRYFRFQEDLRYSSVRQGYADSDPNGTAIFDDTATNNLVGFQFGFDAAYNVCNGLRLFITPKVGLYDNMMESTFDAQLANGTKGVSQVYGPYDPSPHGTKSGLSFLTQIDVGAEWQFTRNWSARAGYRVVAITGMALADDQFPQYMTDIPEMQRVQTSGSLVLSGAFFGLTYNF